MELVATVLKWYVVYVLIGGWIQTVIYIASGVFPNGSYESDLLDEKPIDYWFKWCVYRWVFVLFNRLSRLFNALFNKKYGQFISLSTGLTCEMWDDAIIEVEEWLVKKRNSFLSY